MPFALILHEIVRDDCGSKSSHSLGFFLSFLKCTLPPLLPPFLPPFLPTYLFRLGEEREIREGHGHERV